MRFELDDYNRGLPDEELLADLKRVADKLGKDSVTAAEYTDHGRCHSNTLERRFGSWFSALDRAGLKRTRNYRIPNEELFENLEEVWIHLARQPRRSDIRPPLSKFSSSTYEHRFGTWQRALEAFVQYANDESDPSTPRTRPESSINDSGRIDKTLVTASQTSQGAPVLLGNGHRAKRTVNHRTRFLVIRRDGYRCATCGRSPANELGVELVVDHVTPWSKGGETTLDNLQALCAQCNSGKSNLSQ